MPKFNDQATSLLLVELCRMSALMTQIAKAGVNID
jgi:hypothetical protein